MNQILIGIAIVYAVAGLVYLGTWIVRQRRPRAQAIKMTNKRYAELLDAQDREQDRR